MMDKLLEAITWAEVEAEKARENAEYYAAVPQDFDGHCRDKARRMTEDAERLEALAGAAKRSIEAARKPLTLEEAFSIGRGIWMYQEDDREVIEGLEQAGTVYVKMPCAFTKEDVIDRMKRTKEAEVREG